MGEQLRADTTSVSNLQEPLPDIEQAVENSGGSEGEGPEKGNSRRKSKVWNHFCLSKDGAAATCNYCQQPFTTDGTSHLWRHYRNSHEENADPPQKRPRQSSPVRPASNQGEPSMQLLESSNNNNLPGESSSPTRPAPSSSINQEDCVAELAGMIAFHGYPSSIVDNECFRSFVRGLNPQFQMPSRAAVEATCHQRSQDSKTLLMETLAHCPGNISLALGTVETDQGKVMYMACQFIDEEWTLQKRIMETFKVVPFPPYHHGALLGIKEVSIDEPREAILAKINFPRRAWASSLVDEAACGWGLKGRLFSVARGQELPATACSLGFWGTFHLSFPKRMATFVTYTSDVMNSAADMIFSMLCPFFVDGCFRAVKGLRMDIGKRARYFSELGLNHVGRHDKRWYSYYCALEVLHKEFTDNNVSREEQPVSSSWIKSNTDNKEVLQRYRRRRQVQELLRLRKFKENHLTELLRNILGMTYRAIQRISSSRCPTSNLCMEELMKLRKVLQSEAIDARQNVTLLSYAKFLGFRDGKDVDTVLLDARRVVDNFLDDSLECLSIPAILDPRFKLGYVTNIFNEVFGETAHCRIFCVQKRIKEIFIDYQRKHCIAEGTSSMAAGKSTGDMNPPNWSTTEAESQMTDFFVNKIFKEVYETEAPSSLIPWVREIIEGVVDERRRNEAATFELERYLTDDDGVIPPEKRDGFDVLIWWKENSHRYPTLALMARDALAVPSSDVLSPEHLSIIRSMTSSYGAGAESDDDSEEEWDEE